MGRFGRVALGALLACSLVPMPAGMAVADEVAGSSGDGTGIALAPGTYVEHEAIAYVVDGGVQAFSLGDDVLAGAKSLMDIDADTAAEALGDETAVAGAPAARSRSAARRPPGAWCSCATRANLPKSSSPSLRPTPAWRSPNRTPS